MSVNTDWDNNQTTKTQLKTTYDLRCGRTLARTATAALTSASNATAMDCSQTDCFTYTPTESSTITPTGMQPGQHVQILFLTSGTNSYTITFGTGFHSTGTLASGATSARYFVVTFISDATGTALWEVSRTTAMA